MTGNKWSSKGEWINVNLHNRIASKQEKQMHKTKCNKVNISQNLSKYKSCKQSNIYVSLSYKVLNLKVILYNVYVNGCKDM